MCTAINPILYCIFCWQPLNLLNLLQSVDGRALLNLTKEQVLALTQMKLGPSVKIIDLITQLKTRVGSSGFARQQSTNLQTLGQPSLP